MNEYTVFFFSWMLLAIAPSFAEDRPSPEVCSDLVTTNMDNKDVENFCEVLASTMQPNQLSLEMVQDENTCIAQAKWLGMPLTNSDVLKCLNLKLKWESDKEIDIAPNSLKATVTSNAKLTLAITNSEGTNQTMEQNCKKTLSLNGLQILLSDTFDSLKSGEEETEENESEENDASAELPRFAYCEWSFADQDGEELGIEEITAHGFKIDFEENESDIDCGKNGTNKYDCTHEMDESGHSVTLAIIDETGGVKKTSTCKIPSLEEFGQGYQEMQDYRQQMRGRPVMPPRPIRLNFGGPILSPGVF